MRTHGTLIKWNEDRGFGFIKTRDSGIEVFAHITEFPRDGRRPQVGDALSFTVFTAADSRKQAKALNYDPPQGRADFSLAPVERPVDRPVKPTRDAPAAHPVRARGPAYPRGPQPYRGARRESSRSVSSRLGTLVFGALLIAAAVFGYRAFITSRAGIVDTLHGNGAGNRAVPAITPAAAAPAPSSTYHCDGREHCSQMNSCAEATWFVRHCPNTKMDGDNDGIPCEQGLCSFSGGG